MMFGVFTPTWQDVTLDRQAKEYDLGKQQASISTMTDLLSYLLSARQQQAAEQAQSAYLGTLQQQAVYNWLNNYLQQQNTAKANELAADVARLQNLVKSKGQDVIGSAAGRFADAIASLASGENTASNAGFSPGWLPQEYIPMVPRQIGRQWTLGVSPVNNRFVNMLGQVLAPQNNNVVQNWGNANYAVSGMRNLWQSAAGRVRRNRLTDMLGYANLLSTLGQSTINSLV